MHKVGADAEREYIDKEIPHAKVCSSEIKARTQKYIRVNVHQRYKPHA